MAARVDPRNKPRELRRKLLLSARVRLGASWTDVSIVNISSRGMMIRSNRPLAPGTDVLVHRGDHAIAARVVWRDGARSGLQADDVIPVDQIMTLAEAPPLQLTAPAKRRSPRLRSEDRSRARGRRIEFAGLLAIGVALASAVVAMVEEAFAAPLAIVSSALGG